MSIKIVVQRCGLYEPTRTKELTVESEKKAFDALKELIDDRFSLMVRIRESNKDPHVLVCELNLGFSASLQVLVESHEDLHSLGYKLYKSCDAYSYQYKGQRRQYRE
jgi:hypothetical protein